MALHRLDTGYLRISSAFLSLLLLVSCNDICSSPSPRSDAGAASLASDISKSAHVDEGPFPETVDITPLDTSLLQFAGTKDFANRYSSVVMITDDEPPAAARCSGILIGSRLVLTAGHCVCEPRLSKGLGDELQTIIDASTCKARAHVTAIIYGSRRTKDLADIRIQTHEGSVRPHPELALMVGTKNEPLSDNANLALILLDEPVSGNPVNFGFPKAEVEQNEPLVMVGYGPDKNIGGLYGARHFRENKVTQVLEKSQGRILYEQQGPYIYNGYDGGPCFRESDEGRWLVGIASMGSEHELAFTSTYFYREWLQGEIQRASGLEHRPSVLHPARQK